MTTNSLPLPTRRWEYFYRLLQFCAADVVENPEVKVRRQKADVTDDPDQHNYAWEERAVAGPEAADIAIEATRAWCNLFDEWCRSRDASGITKYIFPDVYAVGFFVAILHCDDAVYFRGQRNDTWKLVTSRTRSSIRDKNELHKKDEDAESFMSRLREDPDVRFYYEGSTPLPEHLVAAAQHYGFPTHYLDLTTEFEVAAYFAEGGSDDWHATDPAGAIYAINASSLPWESTRLVVLPPCFMRPRLQRGVFLHAAPDRLDLDSFEAAKFRFFHTPFPLRRSIGDMRWGKSPGLSEFYFPVGDKFESWCQLTSGTATREQLIKRYHDQWFRDTYDLCIQDRGPGLAWSNDHHMRLRCRCEPVLAVRTFETMVRLLNERSDEHAQPRNSGLVFFLHALVRAILHDGVTPSGMRDRVDKLAKQTNWLHAVGDLPRSH